MRLTTWTDNALRTLTFLAVHPERPVRVAEIAERVGLSSSPCWRRIKRLEEAGVIRQYVALLDADKLGLGLLAYVNVRLEKHSDGAPNAIPTPQYSNHIRTSQMHWQMEERTSTLRPFSSST